MDTTCTGRDRFELEGGREGGRECERDWGEKGPREHAYDALVPPGGTEGGREGGRERDVGEGRREQGGKMKELWS